MPRIRPLADSLISQIAAGEVVERPASIVKELIENALDAGARDIEIRLERGGVAKIVVADDGCGMDREDALLAFDRHATSKISSAADLERIGTLGFRGEALSSIAAVARCRLETALDGEAGTRVVISAGRIQRVEPCVRSRGTTVEVEDLFYNVPARRKFLKRPETELRRAIECVESHCLANPEVAFRLLHGKRSVVEAPLAMVPGEDSASALRGRIRRIYGDELADFLEPIESVPTPSVAISGFVGRPETIGRRCSMLFVNRRWVRDRLLLQTFYRTVRNEWKADAFPALVLSLQLPAEEVDVNVHPQKAEVRFRNPEVLARVEAALAAALRRARSAPKIELSSGSAPVSYRQGTGSTQWLAEPGFGGGDFRPPAAGVASLPAPGRLALPLYAPAERQPVPLTGRAKVEQTLRFLAQYRGSILLFEGAEGLYLIDQHAAHERVLYEQFKRALDASAPVRQVLVEPWLVTVSPAERIALESLDAELARLGFDVTPIGTKELAVRAIPAGVSREEVHDFLAAAAAASERTFESLRQVLLDSRAASMACRGAVKFHQPMNPEALEMLVSDLLSCEDPWACPHGRPTMLHLSDAELERRFGRR